MNRGFSLIELMISAAILGILAAALGAAMSNAQGRAAALLRRERAMQVLEYQADALTRRRRPDAEVEAALLAPLPHAVLQRRALGSGLVELVVVDTPPGGPVQTVRLVVATP